MANDLLKYPALDISAGIDTQATDFVPNFALDPASKNLTTGINQGQAPRYGMSPIPAHSNLDQVELVAGTSSQRGLRASEQTGDEAEVFVERQKFLGVAPLTIGSYDDLTVKGNMFLWLLSDFENGVDTTLSANANCTFTDTPDPIFKYKFDMGFGFSNNIWAQMEDAPLGVVGWRSPLISKIAAPNSSGLTSVEWTRQFLKLEPDVFYASSATIAVSGNKWKQEWMIGDAVGNGSVIDTFSGNFVSIFSTSSNGTWPAGISPSWNLRDYKRNNRSLVFYNLTLNDLMYKFVYSSYPVTDGTYFPTFNQDNAASNYSVASPASLAIQNDRGAPYVPEDITFILLQDPEGFCDSSYRLVLCAAKKPYGFFVQDWQRDTEGRNIQLAPLIDRLQKPICQTTTALPATPHSYYSEDGVQVSTCFTYWPPYATGVALPTEASLSKTSITQHVALGPVDSGVLRAKTDYEFTFSVFDKQLGIETNVGAPAKFRTGDVDFVALSLFRDRKDGGSSKWLQTLPYIQDIPVRANYWTVQGDADLVNVPWINFLEIRFYYRPLGSNDWLPALFIDASKLWFYPDFQVLWACQGDVAGLPGGAPGAFNDYSFLPNDQYTCVVNYKARAFWFSQNNAVFSLRNNPFAYPLRNSFPAPTGGFKGAIIHTYRGQSEQESRLVIFGQKETYIGKFTGLLTSMPVVVSPETIAEFEVEGSDFNVETWTSITSFSHRSAVVADGDLYWWGPEGIFIDDGVGNPTRMSGSLEPLIFSLYDEALVDEIHCTYDDKIKEIVWFYPPKEDNTKTKGIRFNVDTEEFFFDEYDCKIDWAARVSTNNPGVTQKTNGLRTIASIREDRNALVQRGVFLDQINRSGDYAPTKELLVKSVANGTTALRKVLTLDSGISVGALSTIAVGDYIASQQYTSYTQIAGVLDFIAKVVSVNTGTKTITIQLPENTGFLAQASLATANFFPVWHAKKATSGLNGIPWTMRTKYWTPLGPNYSGFFHWCYMQFKYLKWLKVDPTTFRLSYKTPASLGGFIGDTLEFSDNSDGNCQIFHALRPRDPLTGGNNQGQAIKLDLSGVHIGEAWVLQYLELQATLESGNTLKQFQG